MTIKYTTVRLQRKEALLGYTVPKGALSVSVMYSYLAREIVNFI